MNIVIEKEKGRAVFLDLNPGELFRFDPPVGPVHIKMESVGGGPHYAVSLKDGKGQVPMGSAKVLRVTGEVRLLPGPAT